MLKLWKHALPLLLLLGAAVAQQEKPEVRVNMLNVCTPAAEDQAELTAALGRVPAKTAFAPDFEVSRGRSTQEEGPPSSFVRIRRDVAEGYFSTVQYSLSMGKDTIVEMVVFRVRDPKDMLQLVIEDRVTGEVAPASVIATDTPASRIKVERFGKSGIGLARCQEIDQSAYEPLFCSASEILMRFRQAMGVKTTVPGELARLGTGFAAKAKSAGKKTPASAKAAAGKVAPAAASDTKPEAQPPGDPKK